MFKFPIQVPDAKSLFITQGFGVTANTLEPVGPNGEAHFHYGVDIVLGNDHATYGAHLLCPFPKADEAQRIVEPQGDTSHTPFLNLSYSDGTTTYNLILAHCSEMAEATFFNEGDLVGKIGNIGLVWPQPTLKDPYAGAHLHLGLQANGVWVDPLKVFDITNPFIGPGPTQQDAAPATNWLIQRILDILKPFFPA